MKGETANNMEGLPLLEMVVEEAPLVRLTANVSGDSEPVHATLTAIKGRVFCMALSRSMRTDGSVTILNIKQAWRSNFSNEKSPNHPGSSISPRLINR